LRYFRAEFICDLQIAVLSRSCNSLHEQRIIWLRHFDAEKQVPEDGGSEGNIRLNKLGDIDVDNGLKENSDTSFEEKGI
jgi:hypothetical protein